MRSFAILFLLSCLLWQGFPSSRGAGPVTVAEMAHVGWHAEADVHHHHDDGSAHFDDSEESIPHTHVDQGTGSVLLSVNAESGLPSMRTPVPYVLANARAAHWYPDVPLRPPRVPA